MSSKTSTGGTGSMSVGQARARVAAVTNRLMQRKATFEVSDDIDLVPKDTIATLDLRGNATDKVVKRPAPLVRRSQPHLPKSEPKAIKFPSPTDATQTSPSQQAADLDERRAPRMGADCALSRAIYAEARQYLSDREELGHSTPRGKRMLHALKYGTHTVMLENRVVVHWVQDFLSRRDPSLDVENLKTLPKLMKARRRSSVRDVPQRWKDILRECERIAGAEEVEADYLESRVEDLSERLKEEIGAAAIDVKKSIYGLTQGLKKTSRSLQTLAQTCAEHLEGLEDVSANIASRKSEADLLMDRFIADTAKLKKQLRQAWKQRATAAQPEQAAEEEEEVKLETQTGSLNRDSTLGQLLLECEETLIEQPLQKLGDIQTELEHLLHDDDLESSLPDGAQSLPVTRLESQAQCEAEGKSPGTASTATSGHTTSTASPVPWGSPTWGGSKGTNTASPGSERKSLQRKSVPLVYERGLRGRSASATFSPVRPVSSSGQGVLQESKRHRPGLHASRSEPLLPPLTKHQGAKPTENAKS